ncbi:MAG: minor capsid protein [Flavobacteriaceae bacterium]|nr:minor capsid protein [Flavobacteriaceae bacterium]
MIVRIAKLLHSGKLKPEELDQELLEKTYSELKKGAKQGWGKDWDKLQKDGDAIVTEIQNNLYYFSAAKTYQQLLDFNAMLVDENGKIRNFTDFRRKVMTVHETYNQNYLQAEYQTAKRSSQAARQWQSFLKDADLFPNLEYRTVGDDRVRDEHQKLEGVIKPINDTFWDTHYPPNGWRCRCSVRQSDATPTKGIPKVTVERGFENNVGKTGMVFNPDGHPYFAMDKKQLDKLKKQKPKDE